MTEAEKERLLRNIEVIDDAMAEVLRRKTPQERLAIAFNMWTSAKKQITHHLKTIHPDWDDEKINKEVVKRLSHGDI